MLRNYRIRLVASAVAGPMLVGACGPDPTAPPRGPHATAQSLSAVASTDAVIAIDDALTRLLGSLDEETAGALKGPLTAIRAALISRDRGTLTGSLAVARLTLAGSAPRTDDPDLAAISLALDAAAASGQ